MFNINHILNLIKKTWRLTAITLLLTMISSVILNYYILHPTYEANAKIFVGKVLTSDTEYDSSDIQMYQSLLKTYSELLQTKDLIQSALNENAINLNAEDVLKSLKVSPTADTEILEVKYVNENKYLAQQVVDVVINKFIKNSQDLIPNVKLVIVEKPKLPKIASGPQKLGNVFLSFIIVLFITLFLIFFTDYIKHVLYEARKENNNLSEKGAEKSRKNVANSQSVDDNSLWI